MNDEDISGDTTKCAAALAQMTVVSADSATSSKSFQSEGACQASTLTTTGACFCKATVSHFSVYGVIESESVIGSGGMITIGSGSITLGSGSIRFGNSEL